MTGDLHLTERQTVLWRCFNRPWKVVLFSVTVSTVVTVIMMLGVFDRKSIGIALSIAMPTSMVISSIASRLIFQYAARLERKNEELHQLNHDLDAFTRTVSHDLKTPLAAVKLYSEILAEQHESLSSEKQRSYFDRIAHNSVKAAEIVDTLLLFAHMRRADIPMEALDMAPIVQQAWSQMQVLIEEYHPKLELPEYWPPVVGYAPWVEVVWSNFLSNAIKYGGHPPHIQIGATQQDGHVQYWVKDNGAGLSPENQCDVFTEFNQLPRITGHGLGLSIVRRVVERLGGEVGVESQPTYGSTFYFTLPAAQLD